jgi:hypothetical protein|eukprot:31420-Pelagococcus_subviridis.AAC.2
MRRALLRALALLLVIAPAARARDDAAAPFASGGGVDDDDAGKATPKTTTTTPLSDADARARRASFPLYASPSSSASGAVELAWTPPLTPRVFPFDGGDDVDDDDGDDDDDDDAPPGLAAFSTAASDAAIGKTYSVEARACLDDDAAFAASAPPCAAPVVARADGVEGTGYAFRGLTPGVAYAFRVRVSPFDGDDDGDAGAVSAVAIAVASSEEEEDEDDEEDDASYDDASALDAGTDPTRWAFCGATRGFFPNATILLDGGDVRTANAGECCDACARVAGCNAWARCEDEDEDDEDYNEDACEAMGVASGQCWLMFAPVEDVEDVVERGRRARDQKNQNQKNDQNKARSMSHWSPYDRVGVVNADP